MNNDEKYSIDSLKLTVGPNLDKNGVIVIETEDDSNLNPGDIIIEVNREPVTNIDNFLELVKNINKTGRNSLLLKIIRDEKSLWITINFYR